MWSCDKCKKPEVKKFGRVTTIGCEHIAVMVIQNESKAEEE